jgi:CPA1 family monovalent cation:H+ antiporter
MEGEMLHFIVVSLSFFTLLIISSGVYLISKKTKFPYTVLLFLVGLVLVVLSKVTAFSWIASFKLTPEILFFVFLPVLVFESAYNIDYKELLKNGKTIFALAVVGLLISTGLI